MMKIKERPRNFRAETFVYLEKLKIQMSRCTDCLIKQFMNWHHFEVRNLKNF